MSSQLRPLAKRYIELDNQLKSGTNALKDYRPEHKATKERLIELMLAEKADGISVNGGSDTIRISVATKYPRPSKDEIIARMAERLPNGEREAVALYAHVFESNPVETVQFRRHSKKS